MAEKAALIMVCPSEEACFSVLEAEDRTGMLDDLDFIPDNMKKDMVPLLYPIEDYIADLMLLPGYTIKQDAVETYKKGGVTHIALLSLPHVGIGMKFGAANFYLGFVVYYCAAHNKYRLLHCVNCASAAVGWLRDMQNEWGSLYAASEGVQKARPTYN